MGINVIYKVSDSDVEREGIQGVNGDHLDGTVTQNKARFDRLPAFVAQRHNDALDHLDDRINEAMNAARNNLNQTQSSINTRIDNLLASMNAQFTAQGQRVTSLENNLSSLTNKVNSLPTVVHYYGTAYPDMSLGKTGDIYIKTEG